MWPVVGFGVFKVYTFPIVLMVAFYSCLICYVTSFKYDIYFFPIFRKASIYCIIGAILVGKLTFVLTQVRNPELKLIDRINGFVYYGGLIGAVAGTYLYVHYKGTRFLDLLDVYASLVPLGQAIGRIGCYLNGCCYGKRYTGFLSVKYIIDGKETYVFPTWIVESIFCFFLFIIMFMVSVKLYSGIYSAIYMISYSIFRFIIEFFRGDTIRGIWFGLSTSQYISIVVLCSGIVIFVYSIEKKQENRLILGRK